jgi:DNA polymerase-1
MSAHDPVYLIDGSAFIYRAYHAITPLSNHEGLPTHAVYGFTNILLRVIKEKNPTFLAIAFDFRGPTFRKEIYSDYKANRPSMPEDLACQLPYVKKIVTAHNILSLEQQGYEADDLIASAVARLTRKNFPVVIVSGDKDLLQLVSDKVTFWDPMQDKIIDPAGVLKKYNVTPSQLLDFFSLVGDSSDNIPGVAGIGPKTAEKLINQFGSLEQLYAGLDQIPQAGLKEKLGKNRDNAFLSRQLIKLKEELEVPDTGADYLLRAPDSTSLRELYTYLGFSRLLKRDLEPPPTLDCSGFQLVDSADGLSSLVEQLRKASLLVLDTETSSLDPLEAELVGISLCDGLDRGYYIPFGHKNAEGLRVEGQLPREQVLSLLQPLFDDDSLPKLGHNLKFDLQVLENHGVHLKGQLLDSMIASYLIDPSRRTHRLDDLSEELLAKRLTSFAEVTKGDRRPDAFVYVTPAAAKDYSCEDVIATLMLWNHFKPQLETFKLWDLFVTLEMEMVPILARMERAGILVDPKILAEMSKEFSHELESLEEKIYVLAGEPFNINSTRQLAEILFDRLKLPYGRKTKTGYSTDVSVLEKLARYHDLPATIIAHRNLFKLKSTYVDKLAGLIHPRTGRVHTSFNQTVTATGRLSSSNPNLQNIPIRTPEGQRLREAFIAAPGHLFLSADYSQIDLRVLAHYSQDIGLLAAFRAGEDIHAKTAAEIFQVNRSLITPQMRRVAKTINFGIVYGMSAFGLASQLDLSRREANLFISRYFDHYPGVRKFMDEIVQQAQIDGFVTTLLNRRRLLPEIRSANKTRREFAERTAINTPIQGTAADIIKLATIKAQRSIGKKGLQAELILQIHDELVFEVPEREMEKTAATVKESMESVLKLDVPLVVNISTGRNLAEV